MAKTLYHGEFRKLGPVTVTVKDDWKESQKKRGTYYLTLELNGETRYYNPENQATIDFWAGKNGQTLTVVAEGQREEAKFTCVGAPGSQMQPPQTAPPQARGPAPRPQATASAGPAPHQHAAPAPQSPAPQQQHPVSTGTQRGKWLPLGQTVGMAINNACASLTEQGEQLTEEKVWALASTLIRVSYRLEHGQFAPRQQAPPVTQRPPQQPEPSDNDGGNVEPEELP